MTPRRAPVYLLFLGIDSGYRLRREVPSPQPCEGGRAGWTGRSYRPFWTAGGPSSVTGVGSPGRCRHSSLVLVPSHRNLSNSAAVFRRPAFLGCDKLGVRTGMIGWVPRWGIEPLTLLLLSIVLTDYTKRGVCVCVCVCVYGPDSEDPEIQY